MKNNNTRNKYQRERSTKFGEKLKAWRGVMTLKAAAAKFGLKPDSGASYLSKIENGVRPMPGKLLVKVSGVYGVDPAEVIRRAYWPQTHFPMLPDIETVERIWKDIEEYLEQFQTPFNTQEKTELVRYANYLVFKRNRAKR